MARIDIDIEDYLDEVDTDVLVKELKRRNDFTRKNLNELKISLTDIQPPALATGEDVLSYLKIVLRLKPWHDKKRIISEIESL